MEHVLKFGYMNEGDQIHLRDYTVEAEIGAFQSERGRQQRLRFNVLADLIEPAIDVCDDVDRILSYDVLTDAVTAGLSDQRFNLVEALAEKIAAEILVQPRVGQVQVRIEKLDRGPGALGVTIIRHRGRVDVACEQAHPVVLFYGAEIEHVSGPVIMVPDAPLLPVPSGGNERRIALLALDQAAWALGGHKGFDVVDSRTELDWAVKQARPVVWAPARMAADITELEAAPLTLALWLAERIGATRLELALPENVATPDLATTIPVKRIRK